MPRAASTPAPQRRADAVRALLDLACDTAPDRISTAAIAERMGVSHAALFRHFPNRDALWAEAVHWATGELGTRFDAISHRAETEPMVELPALLQAHVEFLQAHPGLLRMLFAELQRPGSSPAREEGKAFMNRFRDRLAGLITRAQSQEALDPCLDPAELAGLLVAINQGLMLQGLVQGNLDSLPERSRQAIALLLRGLRR